jgi:hypothetical protein
MNTLSSKKGPFQWGPLHSQLNRGLGDNSGTRYEILAPGGRFLCG